MGGTRTRRTTHDSNYMNTKLLTFTLALGMISAAPLALAHDKKHEHTDYEPQAGSVTALRAELAHTRTTYDHVYADLDRYGASKAIRQTMAHINAEYNHVGDELNSGRYDTGHVRDEIAHIHDELHQVDGDLHARGERKSEKRQGVTIRIPVER